MSRSKGKEAPKSQTHQPLHIEKSLNDTILRITKGVLKKSMYNSNAHTTQNYSIVEDMSQDPCVMSTLNVLKSFPSQWNKFLSDLGSLDPSDTQVIAFYCENWKPHLTHHANFQIKVISSNYTIHHIVVDEGILWGLYHVIRLSYHLS